MTLALVGVLVVFVIAEFYAHSYVSGLKVISRDEAFDEVYHHFNGSSEFSHSVHGSTVRWLAVWTLQTPISTDNHAWIYLFKTGQNSSLWVHTLDIQPVTFKPTCNNSISHFHLTLEEVSYHDNHIFVTIEYDFGEIGTYEVDFGLVVKIYQKTLLGYLALEEVKIPIQETIYYGP